MSTQRPSGPTGCGPAFAKCAEDMNSLISSVNEATKTVQSATGSKDDFKSYFENVKTLQTQLGTLTTSLKALRSATANKLTDARRKTPGGFTFKEGSTQIINGIEYIFINGTLVVKGT